MRPSMVLALLFVAGFRPALGALFSSSLVDVCIKQAAENVEKIALDQKLDEFGAYKFFQSKNVSEMEFYMKKCKDLTERLRFALIETECEYDLEKYVTLANAKAYPKLLRALAIRNNCLEARAEAGLIGKILVGEPNWVEELEGLMRKEKLRVGDRASKFY